MRGISLSLLLVGGLMALPVQAADALDWIKRLADAERQQNYQGTFVYERSGTFSTHEIWHRVEGDGAVRERLVQLDGQRQEVVRVNDSAQCLGGGMVAQFGDGQLWPARKFNPEELASWYDLKVMGDVRIAGRAAVALSVKPKDQHRYGFELYLDKETGLPLKSLLLNEKGQLLERLQFTRLEATAPTDSQLQASSDCKAVRESKLEAVKTNWHSEWVPPGFALDTTYRWPSPVSDDQVLCLAFDDGLARFSVFLEPLHGKQVGEIRTQFGPTAVVSKRLATEDGGTMVTVVGEIPSGTAERIALSMRPQGSPSQ